jgi:hypothetical protein
MLSTYKHGYLPKGAQFIFLYGSSPSLNLKPNHIIPKAKSYLRLQARAFPRLTHITIKKRNRASFPFLSVRRKTQSPKSTIMAAPTMARSFLQVAATEEVVTPLRVVQIEGLVIQIPHHFFPFHTLTFSLSLTHQFH